MLQPPNFTQRTVGTTLGSMVYYTAPELATQEEYDRVPNLVFLHGFGGGSSAYEWSKVYPSFTHRYRVLAPDLIGWGRSDHPARSYQLEDYLTTLTEFLESNCRQPAIVIASSLTAAMVIRAAILHPQLFKALILVAPSGLSDFGENQGGNFFAQLVGIPVLNQIIYSTAIATPLGIRNFLEQRQFAQANRVSQEMVDAYLASAQQPNAEYSALSFVGGKLSFDLAEFMPQLKTPTVVLWGQKCQFTPPELGQRLVSLNSQAILDFQIIDDVGLTPQLELPAVTIGLIQQALKTLDVA